MYLKKIPSFLTTLFRGVTFRINNSEKIYLTFDDGPHPESTFIILDKLREYNIKVTFFCTGLQVAKHKKIFNKIKSNGHAIGHHGYNHLDGWKTSFHSYVEDVNSASKIIGTKLFRPPYGRLTWSQYKNLNQKYNIILWTNMPGDFDNKLSKESVLNSYKKNLDKGSIIVLHDNPLYLDKTISILDYIYKSNTSNLYASLDSQKL